MKKKFLFLLLFTTEAWAQSYSNQGILNDIVNSDSKELLSNLEPKITSRFIAETQFDDNQETYKDLSGKIRLYNNLHVSKKTWISSYITAERLDNSGTINNGKNRYFDNIGAYFQELNLNINDKKYSLIAGKFNLNFGNAWRWDRGLWIHNLANDYRQSEKLGFSGVYRLGDIQKTGQYNFSLSAFTNDRKNLDNSVWANRDSAHKSDGMPGDTRSLASYNLGLNINFDFGPEEKLAYNFSYLNLATNKRATPVPTAKIADQKGLTLGMDYKFPWQEKLNFDWLIEYTEMKNVGGNSDVEERYLTTNLITKFTPNWSTLFGYSSKDHTVISQTGTNQGLSEVSLCYEFDKQRFFDRLTLQVGYKHLRTNQVSVQTQNTLGALLRYYKFF